MPYFSHDDIAQIGTPPGSALLGALRLSGDNAFGILSRVSRGLDGILAGRPGRASHACRIRVTLRKTTAAGRREAVCWCPARALLMPAPASYTREDVAELHVPGSPALLQAVLDALVREGARAAAPGEFTFRAFRNGRLSLAQAEAVEQVIRAGGEEERRRALSRLGDSLESRIGVWFDRMLDIAARVEAALDFSEEEVDADVVTDLAAIAAELRREGVAIANGVEVRAGVLPHVALAGLANAGKSSLANALLDSEAVLVSPFASTTRDSLHREVEWHGRKLVLSDNPGYHKGGEEAEIMVADRVVRSLGGEDIVCWVVDCSVPPCPDSLAFARKLTGTAVVVASKADAPRAVDPKVYVDMATQAGADVAATVSVSSVTGAGVEDLRRVLARLAGATAAGGQWNSREKRELATALDACDRAAAELAGPGRLELAADDLRGAVESFSRALGAGYADTALARIFSSFCIGK